MLCLDSSWQSVDNKLIGCQFTNTSKLTYEVVEAFYKKKAYKFRVKFINSGYEVIAGRNEVNKGLIKDKLSKYICGVASKGYAEKKDNPKAYAIWLNIIHRCYRPETSGYHNYGGKGIRVCDRWLRFDHFLADLNKIEGYDESLFQSGVYELDKDIKQWHLDKSQRVYSLETCMFVTRSENDKYRERVSKK